MKAISLWQPWASLMAFGEKRIETRSWPTTYRGPLAISATAKIPRYVEYDFELAESLLETPISRYRQDWVRIVVALKRHGIDSLQELPCGAVLCVVELAACLPTMALKEWPENLFALDEAAFGDYSDGRFAWITTNCRRLETPIPCKGKQGLWEWDHGLCENA